MSSGMTNFCANLVLSKLLNGVAGTFPTTFYVGLSTTLPTDTGTNFTEPTGTGAYARQPLIVTGAVSFATLAAGATTNLAIINFGTATATIGTITDWGMFDAITAGSLHLWADLATPQLVSNGNPYSFAIGALGVAII